MAASFHGHIDIVRMLIKTEAEVSQQDEVCCYYHCIAHHLALESSTLVNYSFLSTGWFYCSSPGSSGR